MLTFQRIAAPLLVTVALTTSAFAQTPQPSNVSVLHLVEIADRMVARDRLRAELAADVTDPDAAKVQAEINRRMSGALARINAVPDIAVETNGYSVYQERPDKAPARWHGSQSVTLTAKDFTPLLTLIGTLQQEGLVVRSLTPLLSREARQAVEDALTETALDRLQKRAARIAAQLNSKIDLYRDVRVGNAAAPGPVPMMRAAAASSFSPAPPPVAEPGETQVSVTVDADIVLAR